MDIARGEICRAPRQDRFEKKSKIFSKCEKEHEKTVIRPSSKCPSDGELQFEDILMDIFSR
jgi:hypothetical protein